MKYLKIIALSILLTGPLTMTFPMHAGVQDIACKVVGGGMVVASPLALGVTGMVATIGSVTLHDYIHGEILNDKASSSISLTSSRLYWLPKIITGCVITPVCLVGLVITYGLCKTGLYLIG